MYNYKNLTINEIFSLAVNNHKENKLEVAKKLYYEVLEKDPTHQS